MQVAALLKRREAGKGTLARAEAERAARIEKAAAAEAAAKEAERAKVTPEAAAAQAAERAAREAAAKERAAEQARAEKAEVKRATLQRAAAAEEEEAKARATSSVAGKLKGVAALLAELEVRPRVRPRAISARRPLRPPWTHPRPLLRSHEIWRDLARSGALRSSRSMQRLSRRRGARTRYSPATYS